MIKNDLRPHNSLPRTYIHFLDVTNYILDVTNPLTIKKMDEYCKITMLIALNV